MAKFVIKVTRALDVVELNKHLPFLRRMSVADKEALGGGALGGRRRGRLQRDHYGELLPRRGHLPRLERRGPHHPLLVGLRGLPERLTTQIAETPLLYWGVHGSSPTHADEAGSSIRVERLS